MAVKGPAPLIENSPRAVETIGLKSESFSSSMRASIENCTLNDDSNRRFESGVDRNTDFFGFRSSTALAAFT